MGRFIFVNAPYSSRTNCYPPGPSILLHPSLPPTLDLVPTYFGGMNDVPSRHTQHSATHSPLTPQITKTRPLGLVSTDKSRGTWEGAVRGFVGVGGMRFDWVRRWTQRRVSVRRVRRRDATCQLNLWWCVSNSFLPGRAS